MGFRLGTAVFTLLLGTGCASYTDRDVEPFDPARGLEIEAPPPVAVGREGAHREEIAKGLTLAEARRIALQANPSLAAMADAVNAARARITQAATFSNPVFSFGKFDFPVEAGPNPSDTRQSVPAGDLRAAQTQLALQKDFDVSGKRVARVETAVENERQSEAQFASAALALGAQVRLGYAAVQAAEKNVELSREAREMAQRNRTIVAARAAGGGALPADGLRAEADEERAENDLTQAERDLVRMKRALAALLGDPEANVGPLRDALPLARVADGLDESAVVAEALEKNADVVSAKRAVRAAEANVRLQDRSAIPDVTVQFQYNRYVLDNLDTLGLNVSFPLPVFDRNQGPRAESVALVRQAEHQLVVTERALVQAVRDDLDSLRASRTKIARFERDIVPKYRSAVNLATESYERGKSLYVDVIAARSAFNQTRADYVSELLALEQAAADLERLLGRSLDERRP